MIWILRSIKGLEDSPWNPWYDKAFGFIVAANSEQESRKIAELHAGDESSEWTSKGEVWMNPAYSTCEPLQRKHADDKGLILRDFAAA